MSLVRITTPAEILSLTEAKAHLNVEHTDHDTLIGALLQAAIDMVDGPLGYLARALGPQTWDWFPEHHPHRYGGLHGQAFHPLHCRHGRHAHLELPLSPVISVDEIEYRDTAGTLTPYTTFDVYGLGSVGVASLRPQPNSYWPQTLEAPDSLRVRFTAGYGLANGDSPAGQTEAVPGPIKAAIKLMVGDLYTFRETIAPEAHRVLALPMSTTVERLLAPYRIWTLP